MDTMNDPRLTKESISYDVWRYCVEMEWLVQSQMTGLILGDTQSGYDAGYTPKAYATHKHAQACMQIVDNLSPFAQWVSNYIVNQQELNNVVKDKNGWQPRVGIDEDGWIMQAWWHGVLLGKFRFDKRCPPPPGWKS